MKITNVFGSIISMAALALAGCGGGGGSSSTSSASSVPSITISGTANGVATASASVSKALGVEKALTEAPLAGAEVTVYNLDGDKLGTGTCDSLGKVEIKVAVDEAKPSDASGTEWTGELILVAKKGTIEVATYVEEKVKEADPPTVKIEADFDGKLALDAMFKQGGCESVEKGCKKGLKDIDDFCFFKMEKFNMENASSASTDGLKDDVGKVKDAIGYAMASGKFDPTEHGFKGWHDFSAEYTSGKASAAVQSAVATAAAASAGGSASTWTDAYAAGSASYSAINNIIAVQLAGDVGRTVALSSLSKDISKAEATSESGCDRIKHATTGNDYADKMAKLWLSSESIDEVNKYADDDRMKLMLGMMEQYKGKFDLFVPEVVQGFMAGLSETQVDGYFTGGAFNTTQISGFVQVMNSFDATDNTSYDKKRNWAEGMQSLTGGKFDDFLSGGAIDKDKLNYFAEYCDSNNTQNFAVINPTTLTATLQTQYQSLPPTQQTGFATCTGTFEQCTGGTQTAPPPTQYQLPADQVQVIQQQQQQQQTVTTYTPPTFSCTTADQCGGHACVNGQCSF